MYITAKRLVKANTFEYPPNRFKSISNNNDPKLQRLKSDTVYKNNNERRKFSDSNQIILESSDYNYNCNGSVATPNSNAVRSFIFSNGYGHVEKNQDRSSIGGSITRGSTRTNGGCLRNLTTSDIANINGMNNVNQNRVMSGNKYGRDINQNQKITNNR